MHVLAEMILLAASGVLALLLCASVETGWAAPATPSAPSAGFRAGAAASVITPPLGISINGYFNDRRAQHIHDELHARCLVLDDGKTKLAIVVCDSCMIPREVMDEAKQLIATHGGIPADHVLISATHTHTGPTCTSVFQSDPDKDYQRFLAGRIADGVQRAVNNLAPAKIGWGVGKVPGEVFNRRWRMKPGTVPANPFGGTNDVVKMNPSVGSPDLMEPAGPTDPDVSVVSVQTADGHPLALLANYSLHYVGTSRGNDISADYYGAFCDRIQQLLGVDRQDPPFVALLSNGTSGDINNINFRQAAPARKPYEQIQHVADLVATEVQRVCQAIQYHEAAPLSVAQTEIRLGVRHPTAAEVERAEGTLGKAQGRSLSSAEEIFARETVLIKDYPAEVPVILQTLRIGNLGIVAIPCEVFAEIGLEIKAMSPFEPTFTIELANGYNGYLPTPAQHKLGGYETWRARSSYLETEASPKIVSTVLDLLGKLR